MRSSKRLDWRNTLSTLWNLDDRPMPLYEHEGDTDDELEEDEIRDDTMYS